MDMTSKAKFVEIRSLIAQKYSHLEVHEGEDSIMIEIPTSVGPLKATFNSPWLLRQLLEAFDGFRGILFSGSKTTALFDGTLYAFGRRVSRHEYETPVEEFTLVAGNSSFVVRAANTYSLNNLISLISREAISADDFRKLYSEHLEKGVIEWFGGAELAWSASHILMLLNHTDVGLPHGVPLGLINFPRWDVVFQIKPTEVTAAATKFLRDSSGSMVDFLCFEYYRIHGFFVEMPDLKRPSWHPDPINWGDVYPLKRESRMKESTFRRVDPMLLEHLKAAEYSNTPSFQFLSFYHVLEHFFDTVAMQSLIEEITKTLESPDIYKRRERYAEDIASSLTDRGPNRLDEKMKLKGVLARFVPFLIKNQFPDELRKQTNRSVKFKDGLVLDPITTSTPDDFFSSLASRIYKLRCAIVHSNPTYNRVKSHVTLSEENMKLVSKEVDLLRSIVLEVILRSSSNVAAEVMGEGRHASLSK